MIESSSEKKILLTGATGFLGSNLLKRLLGKGYDVVILKRSFSNIDRISDCMDHIQSCNIDEVTLKQVFAKHSFDTVIHCATNYGRFSHRSIDDLVEANLLLPLEILQLCEHHGTRTFINTDTILDKRVNEYSLSKKQFLDWLKLYENRILCVNVALEHFFGPQDDESKFVSWIVKMFLDNKLEIDFTLGEQKRDFIYIDDVVDAFIVILDHIESLQEKKLYSFEVGSGQTISIKNIVEKIQMLTGNKGTKLNFGTLPYRENEVMNSSVDLTEIRNLGWMPQASLEEGLKKMVESLSKE